MGMEKKRGNRILYDDNRPNVLSIWEFHDGVKVREWDNVDSIAKNYHTHAASIKALIYTGNPLPSVSRPSITFDLDPESDWDLVLNPEANNLRGLYIFKRNTALVDID